MFFQRYFGNTLSTIIKDILTFLVTDTNRVYCPSRLRRRSLQLPEGQQSLTTFLLFKSFPRPPRLDSVSSGCCPETCTHIEELESRLTPRAVLPNPFILSTNPTTTSRLAVRCRMRKCVMLASLALKVVLTSQVPWEED